MKLLPRLWILFCLVMFLIPLGVIVASLTHYDAEIWSYLLDFQLPVLLKNTLFLVGIVSVGVGVIGTSLAWFVSIYQFPARRFFFWGLMLPFAIPAYVLAFTQLGLFDYTGPVSTFFRTHYAVRLPEIRNRWGLAVVMILTFYPYVFLLSRNAFRTMGHRSAEVGASLGLSPIRSFWKIALPMARPWIAGGLVLVLMEVMADFGTVSIFTYDTFTTAIYQAWFDFFSLETAKQLAGIMISIVFLLLILEQLSRGKQKYTQTSRADNYSLKKLSRTKGWLIFSYCTVILLFSFVIPVVQLLIWVYQSWGNPFSKPLWGDIWHSMQAGILGGMATVIIAFLLALSRRKVNTKLATVLTRITTLGYGIPGTVLAVGLFVPIAWLDSQLIHWFGLPSGTRILRGTIWVMVLAYIARFLAIAYSGSDAGLERIRPHHEEAGRLLGLHGFSLIKRIYMPMVKGSIGTALLMVFVDVTKEIPITLMTKPYDWHTLATRVYTFTTEGKFIEASAPALLIVLTGMVPVIFFSRLDDERG